MLLLGKFGIQMDDIISKRIEDGSREWKLLQKKMFAKYVHATVLVSGCSMIHAATPQKEEFVAGRQYCGAL